MTTAQLQNPSAPGPFKRFYNWLNPVVAPHEMTDGERKLKKILYACVAVPTVSIIVLMAQLGHYSQGLAEADAAVAVGYSLVNPGDAKVVAAVTAGKLDSLQPADAAAVERLQAQQRAARHAISQPVPLCWMANCDKQKN